MEAEPASSQSVQRYYDPGIGRFLSRDAVTAYDSGDMRFFNRYAYVFNSPYRFTDPDGRQSADRAYGAAVGLMLRDNPEAMRVWAGGEAAAGTEGSAAEQGAVMGEVAGEFIDAGDFSGEALGEATAKIAIAAALRGKKGRGSEHTKNARPSTKGKHEQGQARKQRDRGGEKGDSSRAPPRKPPPNHKGPWPPKPPPQKPKREGDT